MARTRRRPTAKPSRPSFLWFLLFAALFALQAAPRLLSDSPTGDEVMELSNGFFYWGGDVISNPHHPPLAKGLQALPLRFMGLVKSAPVAPTSYEQRAHEFLFYWNRDRMDGMMAASRSVTLLLGLALGFLLFLAARERGGAFLFFAMSLWALEPNLLAFSPQVLADVPLAFLFFLAVLLFQRNLEGGGWKGALITGVTAGMAIGAKFSAVVLVPLFLLLDLFQWNKAGGWGPVLRRWAFGLSGALGFLCLLYLPGTLKLPEHAFPLHYFLEGFQAMASFPGHPTYFMGELSGRNHWAYYPLAFLLKSPIPFLVFLVVGTVGTFRGYIRVPLWHWLPGLLFFACVAPFQNIGIREVLPSYPFFLLTASAGAAWFWEGRGKWAKSLAIGLVLFQLLSVGSAFPAHIGYFNEFIHKDKRVFWLGDSNLDIGQDTKRLAQFAEKNGWRKPKLAYFGVTDPKVYGLVWEPVDAKDLAAPQPGAIYAINDAYRQLGPAFLPEARAVDASWIAHAIPSGRIGDTWTYFVVPVR